MEHQSAPLASQKKGEPFWNLSAMVLSVIALVLAGIWMVHPLLQARKELSRISTEVKDKKPKVDAIEVIQKEKALLEKGIHEFEALRAEEISKLEILKELSEILPATVWVWNVKLKSKDVEINGFANSASDLIAILDKSSLLEKVEFSSPVTKERRLFGEQSEKERFRNQCETGEDEVKAIRLKIPWKTMRAEGGTSSSWSCWVGSFSGCFNLRSCL